MNELTRHRAQGRDDTLGRIANLLVEDDTWRVRYLVLTTSSWWFGKKVLVAPQWATGVD